jgi:hypothetical protein
MVLYLQLSKIDTYRSEITVPIMQYEVPLGQYEGLNTFLNQDRLQVSLCMSVRFFCPH